VGGEPLAVEGFTANPPLPIEGITANPLDIEGYLAKEHA